MIAARASHIVISTNARLGERPGRGAAALSADRRSTERKRDGRRRSVAVSVSGSSCSRPAATA